ncbi:MAG: hypothetical protein WBF93_02275, partial [Pirellulales bacterium]
MSIPLSTPTELLRPLQEKFSDLRARLRRWLLIDGVRQLLWWLLAVVVIDFVIDWSFGLDRPQRLVLLLLAVLLIGWVAVRRLMMPLLQRPSDDALCVRIQRRHRLGDSLINAVQLARVENAEQHGFSPTMIRESIHSGLAATSALNFDDVLDSRVYRRNVLAVVLTGVVLLGLAFCVLTTETMSLWFSRNVLLGDRPWPQETYLAFTDGHDGAIRVPRGADWPITIQVEPYSRRFPEEITLEIESENRIREETLLPSSVGTRFSTTLKQVVRPLRIRATTGRIVTAWIDVWPIDYPAVAQLELHAVPPGYTGQPRRSLSPEKSQAPVLEGSRLEVTGRSSKPLTSAKLYRLTNSSEQEVATFTINSADKTGFQADLT